jgi:hypothetical protein
VILKLFITFLFLTAMAAASQSVPDPSTEITETRRQRNLRLIKGSSILALEYIGGTAIAFHVWWPHGFRLINPFSNIGEREPFLVDDGWHLWGNAAMQELHYTLMKKYFHVQNPFPSMILTSVTWFGVEVLDAMEKENGWRLSLTDEYANLAGVSFWYLKHRFPDLPVYIRGGFRKWSTAWDYIADAPLFFTDRDRYGARYTQDKYAKFKIELIYKFHKEFYAGMALSRLDKDSDDNVWGLTVGWDVISKFNRSRKGWWNFPLGLISEFGALSLSFTLWTDKRVTPI